MELFLVRHAIAEERRLELPDAERALTPRGIERFTRHVATLRELGVRFTEIRHSPWRRAVQTAELLAPLSPAPVRVEPLLAAPPSEALLETLFPVAAADAHVALVGHQPWLSDLLCWLVFGSPDMGDTRVQLKKGAIAHLEGDPRSEGMMLRGLYAPRFLRRG
jgi:phosphohistidine phosphatase